MKSDYNGNFPEGGTFGKGFMRLLRAMKREEADRRNAKTQPSRRRAARKLVR